MEVSRTLLKMMLNISCSILAWIFSIYCMSFVGFIFHLNVNSLYPIISFFLSYGCLYLLLKKQEFSLNQAIISFIILTSIYIISFKFGTFFYDSSWDGRNYHQASIVLLSKGWNPVYDNISNFCGFLYNTPIDGSLWIENYPKFAEIVQSNICLLTSNIETGKALNLLVLIVLYAYSLYVLSKKDFSKIKNVYKHLLSLLIIANPIVIGQFLTFYIDFYIYTFFMIILFAIIDIETHAENKNIPLGFILMSSVCLINVKLGGGLYFILTMVCYFVYLVLLKKKTSVINLAKLIILIIVLAVLSGVNPYLTNIWNGNHPLHPLAGKNKIDIIQGNTPKDIYNKPFACRFFASTFAKVDNFGYESNSKIHYKVPLWIYKSELKKLGHTDMRICGFGVFWSAIFILSTILIFFIRYPSLKQRHLGLLIFTILGLLFILNPYSWWARYVPHLWACPLFISAFILNKQNVKYYERTLVIILLFIMLANIIIQSMYAFKVERGYRKKITKLITEIKQYDKPIKIYNIYDWGMVGKISSQIENISYVDETYYKLNKNKFRPIIYTLGDLTFWDYEE